MNIDQKENLLTQIGEFVATEIENVENYEYMPRELGYVLRLTMKNDEVILISIL